MSIVFKIIRNGSDFSCSADNGPNFFVGRQTTYKTRVGLFNIFSGSKLTKLLYNSENYTGEHQFWARFIDPTAGCEGRSFLTLNTYDRAAFTFGFSQFAAHVPDGDFVRYFRAMLALPEADDYFPGLTLVDGRIARRADNGTTTLLETKNDTTPLMRYLNPSSDGVEDAEVIAAAKLIHWTTAQRSARLLQIKQMIEDIGETDQPIPLPNVSSSVLTKVLEYCSHHRHDPPVPADDTDEMRRRATQISE